MVVVGDDDASGREGTKLLNLKRSQELDIRTHVDDCVVVLKEKAE